MAKVDLLPSGRYEGDKLSHAIQDALDTGAALARLGFGNGAIRDLYSISRQLHRLDERACNGYRDERDKRRNESRERDLMAKVHAMMSGTGIPAGTWAYHQTDPRGCALYVCPPEVKDYAHWVAV